MSGNAPQGWVYSQSTGELTHDGRHVATGYAGSGIGRNNPQMQTTHDVGPVPQGTYTTGSQCHSGTTGPGALRLTPNPGTQTHGRRDLEVHGDSIAHPGEASTGCSIVGPDVRRQMTNATITVLP